MTSRHYRHETSSNIEARIITSTAQNTHLPRRAPNNDRWQDADVGRSLSPDARRFRKNC